MILNQENTIKNLRYRKTKHILGEGSYKTVTKAVDEEEGKEVAYNELRIRNYEIETKAETPFSNEVALLKTIDHQNILNIIDFWFSDEKFIFITELMTGGSLSVYIEKNGPLGVKLIRKWAKQILDGLVHLHTRNPPIIHRDIKNENIFLNSATGDIKIGDLGLARERRTKRFTLVGTPQCMAREMFEGEGYTEKVDVYAFGLCLIEMATGKQPYGEFTDTKEVYKCVLQGVLPQALQEVNDPCLKSLIVSCLVPSQSRFTSSQCLSHHFFHTDVVCNGSCVPAESVAVYPLPGVAEMELSIVGVTNTKITFQIYVFESQKFIKFEFDLTSDTVEKICDELVNEKIIEESNIEKFSSLLSHGTVTVESKMKFGQVHDGLIELTSQEVQDMKNRNFLISNRIEEISDESEGNATLEEIQLIEEQMKIQESKQEMERQKEEETTFRLQQKIEQKDASYEPDRAVMEEAISRQKAILEENNSCEVEIAKCVNFKNSTREIATPEDSLYTQVPGTDAPLPHGENCTCLAKSYELAKEKYRTNYPISQFVFDSAVITSRSEETAKGWLKVLRDEQIQTVGDLRLLVYEDWERIPLTVFACRIMQNVLYGIGEGPLREKQQPSNPLAGDYDNRMKIKDFLIEICRLVGRDELVGVWENKLLAEDIQTVGELRSLHNEDWERLGLSVYAFRVLKNVIDKRGRILEY